MVLKGFRFIRRMHGLHDWGRRGKWVPALDAIRQLEGQELTPNNRITSTEAEGGRVGGGEEDGRGGGGGGLGGKVRTGYYKTYVKLIETCIKPYIKLTSRSAVDGAGPGNEQEYRRRRRARKRAGVPLTAQVQETSRSTVDGAGPGSEQVYRRRRRTRKRAGVP